MSGDRWKGAGWFCKCNFKIPGMSNIWVNYVNHKEEPTAPKNAEYRCPLCETYYDKNRKKISA